MGAIHFYTQLLTASFIKIKVDCLLTLHTATLLSTHYDSGSKTAITGHPSQ